MKEMLIYNVSDRVPLNIYKKSYQDLKHIASVERHSYAPLVSVTYYLDRRIRVDDVTAAA